MDGKQIAEGLAQAPVDPGPNARIDRGGGFRAIGEVAAAMIPPGEMDEMMAEHHAWWARSERALHIEALFAAIDTCEPGVAAAVMCAEVDRLGVGMPPVALFSERLRSDAVLWADMASPAELEAYIGAGLRAIEGGVFAARARKRLIVALWETMPDAWKRDFLRRVDPNGNFLRGAA